MRMVGESIGGAWEGLILGEMTGVGGDLLRFPRGVMGAMRDVEVVGPGIWHSWLTSAAQRPHLSLQAPDVPRRRRRHNGLRLVQLVIGIREANVRYPTHISSRPRCLATGLEQQAALEPRTGANAKTANTPAKRTGRGSTSSPSSRPRRIATRCAGTSRTRSGRRSSWART